MKKLALVELLLLAALWGGSFLFMRIAAPVLGPVWLIEGRVLLAGIVLLPLVARLNRLGDLRRYWQPLLIVGGLNSAIPFCFLAYASITLSTGFTSILNATAPLFGMAIATLWFHEKLTRSRIIGFALGFAGVVVLVGWQTLALTTTSMLAIAAVLSAALMYAIAAPYIKRTLADVPALVITTGSQLGAAVVLLPILPFSVPQQSPTALVIGAVIALALLSTALAYLLYFRLIQAVGSTRALTVTYLIPLFAMFWGALILQEPVTSAMVLGCALVLLGTAIANDLFRPQPNP